MDAVARRDQHRDRSVEVLALEGAVERVGEEHDLTAGLGPLGAALGAKTSERQRGRLRRAENCASFSDRALSAGTRSRRLKSQGALAARPA